MDPIFIAALMTGLLKALEKLADKALIDPALERGLAPFKQWLARGYDEAKDDAELTRICQAALEDLRNQYAVAEPERLIPTWQLAGLKPDQLSALAAAALEMTTYDPETLSPQLLTRLGLNPNQRDLLAKFLFLLRKYLTSSPRFREALQYADEADRRGQLLGLSAQILDLQAHASWAGSYLELLAQARLSEGFRSDLINEMLDRFETRTQPAALQLAGKLAIDMGETLPGPEHKRVEQSLLAALTGTTLPAKARVAAGRTLARLGDPRPEVMTVAEMRFCFVPEGLFWMGEGEQAHQISLPDYWLGLHPVSDAQFAVFVKDQGYTNPAWWSEARQAGVWSESGFKGEREEQSRLNPVIFTDPSFRFPNCPVVGVSWYEALAYTRWLDVYARKKGWIPDGLHLCLPSDTEWEKAARGGLSLPAQPILRPLQHISLPDLFSRSDNLAPQREYPWIGEFSSENANVIETGIYDISALGCFARGAGPYGSLDLGGNVWEWQEDWWDSKHEFNEMRGGSCFFSRDGARCSFDGFDPPDYGGAVVSLRCALSSRS